MAKYSVPGIKFTEIDNSIRNDSTPGIGIGAIVMKSNKGPVNQRVLTSSYNHFTEIYGEPENLDDYGHFAAENYLAISNQLLAVRATMGDEGYSQIQYPYTDADIKDKYLSTDTSEFKYVDNETNSNLKLIEPLSAITTVSSLNVNDEWIVDKSGMYAKQRAQFATITDLLNQGTSSVAVYKAIAASGADLEKDSIEEASGTYITYPSNINNNGNATKFSSILFTDEAITSGIMPVSSIASGKSITVLYPDPETPTTTLSSKGYRLEYVIPSTDSLNGENVSVTAYYKSDFTESLFEETSGYVNYTDLFNNDNFFVGSASGTNVVTSSDAVKIVFKDWDDVTNKTYYVEKNTFEKSVGQCIGIKYREYGFNDEQEVLAGIMEGTNITDNIIVKSLSDIMADTSIDGIAKINYLADEYGCDAADLMSNKYSLLQYYHVWEGKEYGEDGQLLNEMVEKVIYTEEWNNFVAENEGTLGNEYLFYTISEKESQKATTLSVYVANEPNNVVIPWQEGMKKDEEDAEPINKMTAFASTEIFNSSDETYKDGYTISIESDDEPGNGDIERYVSNKSNQLIIASIGPGEYGNDIGISIITTECADVPALNHQNAFNWKYRYDDEELVDNDADNLTWKKVYRINVYVKSKSQTAKSAWGFGMDALLKDPSESWYVSNDPSAKDAEGNSLFAPNVINGHSEYIYISRNSVNEAKTSAGTYAQPKQTYAIYPLTGGSNSKKNNMTEKTAALKLYKDRQKADFDIIFNVDAVESFNSKQRYSAHQRKIAEIAGSRKIDIGVVQVTSKESKTIKRQLSEAKMFTFNNGSYVAEYAGYDKYYNSTLASWIYLPKSVAGACAMAFCDIYSYPWFAPAGLTRGQINYSNNQLTKLTDDEIGQLYTINVNTSRDCRGYGEILWGQKTALKKESAINRINVRRCLNYIEKTLELAMVPYLFQQNTPNTRTSAKNTIDAFLSRVQAAEGIISFSSSVTQDDEDPHIMLVNLRVIPAESIEFIDVKITIDRNNGVSAEEV